MAEFGDLAGLVGGESEKKTEITTQMLDYTFVDECQDIEVLKGVVEALKTGRDGHYPDLEKRAEDKLLELLPAKDKLKIMRLKHKTTPQEVSEAESAVSSWEKSVAKKDKKILGHSDENVNVADPKQVFASVPVKNMPSKRSIPPVRGTSSESAASAAGSKKTVITNTPSSASSGGSATSPAGEEKNSNADRLGEADFRGWEKFDADAAVDAVDGDMFDMSKMKMGKSAEELRMAGATKRTLAHEKQMEQILKDMGGEGLSALQRSTRSAREKTKGNECFRVGENEEAIGCYSRSLALDPTNPLTYSNRAMAYIRMDRFEAAEDDCTRSLQLDNTYLKAWSRRGMTRFKRGNYKGSAEDFEEAQSLQPEQENAELKKLAQNAYDKYFEVEGKPLRPSSADVCAVPLGKCKSQDELPLPPSYAVLLKQGKCDITQSASSSTTIAIEEDDDDEDEEDGASGFTRIQISDADGSGSDSDSEEEEQGDFIRIPISVESDSDSDSDSEDEGGDGERGEKGEKRTLIIVPTEEEKAQAVLFKDEGNGLMKAGKQQDAVVAYSKALALQPDLLAALNNRAMAHLALKQYSQVVNDTTLVIQIEPNNAKALYRRAAANNALGNHTYAVSDLDRVLGLDNNNPQASKLRSEALKAKENALDLGSGGSPNTSWEVEQLKRLAINALEQGNHEQAVEVLERALTAEYFKIANIGDGAADDNLETKVALLHLLYTAQLRSGQADQAQDSLNSILKMQPNNFKALLKRAEVLKQLGNISKAKSDVEVALQIDPKNMIALQLLSSLTEGQNKKCQELKAKGNEAMADQKFAEAVRLYTAAVEADPTSVVSLNNRAQAYLKRGDYSLAVADASSVMTRCEGAENKEEMQGQLKKALFRRAFSLRELGKTDAALQDFTTLVQLEPANKTFRGELERTQSLKTQSGIRQVHTSMPPPVPGPGQVSGSSDSIGLTAKATKKIERKVVAVEELPPVPSNSDSASVSSPKKAEKAEKGAEKEKDGSSSGSGSGSGPASKKKESAAKVVSPLKPPAVPTDPPKTVYELERIWRALKSYPEMFAQYLTVFKKGTYKKLFKETIDCDLLSSVFACLSLHAAPTTITIALEGISKTENFGMMLALLPDGDLGVIGACVKKLENEGGDYAQKAKEMKALYKCN